MAGISFADEIRGCVQNSLNSSGVVCKIETANNGKCVSCRDGILNLWIRLLPLSDNTCKVEISTIEFNLDLQRRGIFTKLYSDLKSCSVVGRVSIESVCTNEMLNWCNKNGLTGNYYNSFE